ncbi:biotin/lipoyl-containing protein [Bradyrhizobium sp. 1]|uniref:biotin/lipoyl-containing protein n=1 Tax=Bradyrhizobium sp. 1 TaxID=241591 RepID=UPI001FF791B4|nr:biotin/lipoyl-containing protein [Bradyrhizobium sp. 1]MCK1394447.1 acetyl-CoA carboxylase biotin carboxyl carrier protein subunit [Bradyrhizobium sp. 1]
MKKIVSPMAGTVWKILKSVGDPVEYGDAVVILESMKMEIPVDATSQGVVTKVVAQEGDVVDQDTVLIELS